MNNLTIPLLYVLAGLIVFAINFGKKVFSGGSSEKPLEERSESEKTKIRERRSKIINSNPNALPPLIDFSKWGSKNEK